MAVYFREPLMPTNSMDKGPCKATTGRSILADGRTTSSKEKASTSGQTVTLFEESTGRVKEKVSG
jgi:hypothetical protein